MKIIVEGTNTEFGCLDTISAALKIIKQNIIGPVDYELRLSGSLTKLKGDK